MHQRPTDTPEQVLIAPKEKAPADHDAVDETGHALIALLQEAANLSTEHFDRAMSTAHKLSVQVRASEDRIKQLQAEVEHFRDRAVRAERWLQVIQKEIEEKLIAPMASERPSLH
jgi:cell fate (sporulation/competence/biofilm development) regulator YmcA (YheA/YmcA/DUF963 family)